MPTPAIAVKIAAQPSQPCCSCNKNADKIAANTGMVATAVNTTLAEVSTMPSVKVTEFRLNVAITNKPCHVMTVRKSRQGWRVNKSHQMANDITPINIPRQPIKVQRSSPDSLITNVSGVNTKMPASASKVPNRPGLPFMYEVNQPGITIVMTNP